MPSFQTLEIACGHYRQDPLSNLESRHPQVGLATTAKTFRIKRDAQDWARRTEDEMVRGVYIQRSASERLTLEAALKRYLADITPTKKPCSQKWSPTTVKSA